MSNIDADDILFKVLNKKYLMIKQIGEGGYASIWLALDFYTCTYYAIKIQNADDESEAKDEVKTLKMVNKLCSKTFVNMVDNFIYDDDGANNICIVLELMNCSLDMLIKTRQLPYNFIIRTMNLLCDAVKKISSIELVHTDIKPENIFIHHPNVPNNDIMEFEKLGFKQEFNKRNSNKKTKLQNCLTCAKILLDKHKKMMENEDSDEDDELQTSDNTVDGNSSYEISKYRYDKSELTDSDNDDDNDDDDDKYSYDIVHDDIFFDECTIKLADFGTAMKECDLKTHNIQTMYYRAPEAFLKCVACAKCDIWSIGCVFYELITGEMLFNPEKTNICGENRHMMQLIYQLTGQTMTRQMKDGLLVDIYYRDDMTPKGNCELTFDNFSDKIMSKLKLRNDIDQNKNKKIVDALQDILIFDPNMRMTINECVNCFLQF
jgi:serine/threonine-protein kinase SRPK3